MSNQHPDQYQSASPSGGDLRGAGPVPTGRRAPLPRRLSAAKGRPAERGESLRAECEANNGGAVSLVIDEWILWEYACCYISMNVNATVETVRKSLPPEFAAALGIEIAPLAPPKTVPFIALTEYKQAIERRLKALIGIGLPKRQLKMCWSDEKKGYNDCVHLPGE